MEYESRIHDNWPNYVGQALQVEVAVRRCANLPLRYSHGGSASVPSGSSSLGAALTLTAMQGSSPDHSIEDLLSPVPSNDEAHHIASIGVDLTTETEDDIEPLDLLPHLPKRLRTSLGAMPTRPDIPAPPLLKAAFTNATKKIPKKMSQVDKVSELMKRRDDLLDYIQDKIKPFMQTVTSNFTDTASTVFPYMEKQKKQIEGLQEELTKVQKTSNEQAILTGRKDLALQTLRVKSKGLISRRGRRRSRLSRRS